MDIYATGSHTMQKSSIFSISKWSLQKKVDTRRVNSKHKNLNKNDYAFNFMLSIILKN